MKLSNIHDDFDEYAGLDDVDTFEVEERDELQIAIELLEDAEVDIADGGYDVWQIPVVNGYGPHELEVDNPNGPNALIALMNDLTMEIRAENISAGGFVFPETDICEVIAEVFDELDTEESRLELERTQGEIEEDFDEYENLDDVDKFEHPGPGLDDLELRMMANEFVHSLNGRSPIEPERVLEKGGYAFEDVPGGWLEIDEIPDVRGNPTFSVQTEDLIQYYKISWSPDAMSYDESGIPTNNNTGKWMVERIP